jgi:lauroyl/myristoyl acyltransferase
MEHVRQKMDDLLLMHDDTEVRCRSFRGREHLDSALSQGKGVMLLSLHWFANRAANRYLASLGYPVMAVRNHVPPDRRMGRLGRKLLQPRYIRLLRGVIRDEVDVQDRECSLKMLQRLRRGGIVEINLDAAFSNHLIPGVFLSRSRRFPAGFLHLAKLSGCTLLPKLALGNVSDLELNLGRPLEMDLHPSGKEFCGAYVSSLMKTLESQVLAHPDQWERWTRI